MDRRVLVICNELFTPLNSGGRIDVGRHVEALYAMPGHRLALLTWFDSRGEELQQDRVEAVRRYFDTITVLPIKTDFSSLVARLGLILSLP